MRLLLILAIAAAITFVWARSRRSGAIRLTARLTQLEPIHPAGKGDAPMQEVRIPRNHRGILEITGSDNENDPQPIDGAATLVLPEGTTLVTADTENAGQITLRSGDEEGVVEATMRADARLGEGEVVIETPLRIVVADEATGLVAKLTGITPGQVE